MGDVYVTCRSYCLFITRWHTVFLSRRVTADRRTRWLTDRRRLILRAVIVHDLDLDSTRIYVDATLVCRWAATSASFQVSSDRSKSFLAVLSVCPWLTSSSPVSYNLQAQCLLWYGKLPSTSSTSASLSPVSPPDNIFTLQAEVFSPCLAIVSAVIVGGLFLWPALRYETGYQTVWEIWPSAETPSSVHWRRFYFPLTRVHSALELFGGGAVQIYLLTYLLTYLCFGCSSISHCRASKLFFLSTCSVFFSLPFSQWLLRPVFPENI